MPQVFRDLVRRMRRRSASAGAVAEASALHPAELTVALARLERIRDECRRLVTKRASLSAGVSVVPLPGLDLGTDVAILLKLLPRINQRFGLTPAQIDSLDAETKRVVLTFVGSVGSVLVGRLITREIVVKVLMRMGVRLTAAGVVKYVPLLGQALSATISFGAMKLLGDRHVDDCYQVARRTLLERARDSWEIVP